MRNSSSQEASRARSVVAWSRCGFGRAVLCVGPKVRPRVSGEKRAEDVLPSWRSMRSLTVNGTALGLGSGSLAGNGETSARACSPRMWVSRRIEEFLSAKRAAAIRTRVADKGFEADRYSCEFAIHTWPRVCRISRTRSSTLRPISICAAGTNRRTPASIATGHCPMATRASVLNNALGRCISNLFPRSCHASLGPAYLSDGHSQYPYRLSNSDPAPSVPLVLLRDICSYC